MLEENIKKRPLSGKFPTLKSNLKEKPKLVIQNRATGMHISET